MTDATQTTTAKPTSRGLMGPVILITIGVIFLIGEMGWGLRFRDLWPVILIVIGAVKVFEAMTSGSQSTGTGGSSEQR